MNDNNIPSNTNDNSNKSTDKNKHVEKPIHYFNKVIKNMDNKELSKLKVIYKTEISMEFCDFDEQLIKQYTKNDELEEYLKNSDSLFWIEFIENEILYSALKALRFQDLIILNIWINKKFT